MGRSHCVWPLPWSPPPVPNCIMIRRLLHLPHSVERDKHPYTFWYPVGPHFSFLNIPIGCRTSIRITLEPIFENATSKFDNSTKPLAFLRLFEGTGDSRQLQMSRWRIMTSIIGSSEEICATILWLDPTSRAWLPKIGKWSSQGPEK